MNDPILQQPDLSHEPGSHWKQLMTGGSRLDLTDSGWRFVDAPVGSGRYTNAQIDDYEGLRRPDFLWKPPLRLTVQARFSHPSGDLVGTAGFGFWNDPFMMTGWRVPALPRALWFFYASPPSNMKLDLNTPGCGWKAAALDAIRLPFFLLAPTAPIAIPLMNIEPLYRALWPIGQRTMGVGEALLDVDMTGWHTYTLEWRKKRASFSVDSRPVLDCAAPRGPLGFVMWIDTQSLVATPWGQFRWQALPLDHEQWMEVADLRIERMG
jgi:hypothetical protein